MKEETWENIQIPTVRLRCDMSTVLGLALERGAQIVDADWAARIPTYRQYRDARAAMLELEPVTSSELSAWEVALRVRGCASRAALTRSGRPFRSTRSPTATCRTAAPAEYPRNTRASASATARARTSAVAETGNGGRVESFMRLP